MWDNQGCLGSSKDCFRLRNGEERKDSLRVVKNLGI